MSPRRGGVGSTGRGLLPCDSAGWRFTRGDPLWPAGHLPLKGEISPLTIASPSLGALAAPRQQLEPDAP